MTNRQTQRLKKAFLEQFRLCGNISQSCRDVGMDRSNVYRWQEIDDQFAAAFRDAETESTETLEAEARRRALEGVEKETPIYHNGHLIGTTVETKYSDTLLIFLLKGLKPEKYRERQQVEHTGPGGGPVEISDSRDELARRIAGLAARGGAGRVVDEPQ